ncbi:YcxB family protein [Paenibacillus sp. GP183]|uniref:YcxB family protein n=1 Tax=Paenibacillus sp. GP183 TaxID=1882751 RepID=UPI0008976A70|nr:YcxB-like protein [Paenibacillus sp. GP183]
MIPFYVYFFSKKKYEQNRSVYEEKECILRKEGLLIKSDSTSTDLKWSDLHKFKLTKEFLLFYFSKYQAITIPTRVFTQVQIRHVLKLAKVKVKNKISAIAVISVTFVILLAFLLIVGIIHFISRVRVMTLPTAIMTYSQNSYFVHMSLNRKNPLILLLGN